MLIFSLLSVINTPKSQAATVGENLQVARQVIESVSPVATVISKINTDEFQAALVFAPDGYVTKPMVIETKITKESVKKTKITVVNPQLVFVDKSGGNHFPYGWCTYYVASRRNVPWFGNAGTWLGGALKTGFSTGGTPQVGAIIVTSESRWGHVGIVEAIDGGNITITEMNYVGFGRISSRTISANYGAIKGYIY